MERPAETAVVERLVQRRVGRWSGEVSPVVAGLVVVIGLGRCARVERGSAVWGYDGSVGKEFAGVVEGDDPVAEQAPALLWLRGYDSSGFGVARLSLGTMGLMLTHQVLPRCGLLCDGRLTATAVFRRECDASHLPVAHTTDLCLPLSPQLRHVVGS